MLKKNYRRREVLKDWNFGLKQRFNIKCGLDLAIFLLIFTLFSVLCLKHEIASYESATYMAIILAIFIPSHFITKQWISKAIVKSLTMQSESLAETTDDIAKTVGFQKQILDNLSSNSKNISNLVEKLKDLLKYLVGLINWSTTVRAILFLVFSLRL